MELKHYQKKVINDLNRFLSLLVEGQNISNAYKKLWEEKGVSVGLNGMPFYHSEIAGVPQVCFKVPTGGGKTFLAANSIKPIFDSMPQVHPKAVVWLVPSDAILTQTYAALTDKEHDYRRKIDVDFGNRVEVYSKEQLLNGQNFNPVSVRENLSIFVLSYDSFRTSKKEGRKAYQENGYLLPFVNFKPNTDILLEGTDESALIQVIRMLNPVVIVDESHHAVSHLSKEMLMNFNPSFVLDLTATPKKGSNIISFVDARQLKSEHMVKLPVIVYNRKSQEDVFLSAISLRAKLEAEAKKEQKRNNRYIRPIVLFQAQPRKGEESTTYDKIKNTLVEIGIPKEQIAIKTSTKDELKNINLKSPDCEIRYIITVNALKEGWDCPFAYILATVANRSSMVDVEQILGRVLRLPYASENKSDVLNLSYVITSSTAFYATLDKVVAGLNAAGFSSNDYRAEDFSLEINQSENAEIPVQMQLKFEEENVNNNIEEALDVTTLKEQLTQVLNNNYSEAEQTEDTQNTTDFVSQMMERAKQENKVYWEEMNKEDTDNSVPLEVAEKMKRYKMNPSYEEDAIAVELPQFMLEIGISLFSDTNYTLLTKESLYTGFSLIDKDTEIDFDSLDTEIAKVDIDDKDSLPKAWKLQGFDNQYMKEWFDEQPSEKKLRLCKQMIISKLSKNNAINDLELKAYVDRIVEKMTKDQLTDLERSPYLYIEKINKKVNSLLSIHAKKVFHEWVEQDKIVCLPSYKLPKEIAPLTTVSSIPKALYSEEEKFDNEYERKVVMELSALNNIKWWHRNIARKGFSINGAVNAYPDLIVKTESGKLLLIETKGDQLENSESRIKAETGSVWASMAGRLFKYYMVFETKSPNYSGAYSYEEFMRIVKEL